MENCMGTVTTSLYDRAKSIFRDLGYDVSKNGGELLAERKWRLVQVTPMAEPRDPPTSGGLRCFVTWSEHLAAVEQTVRQANPEYDWAVIGVGDGGDYSIARPV